MHPGPTPSERDHWLSRGGAILLERSTWPVLTCHVLRTPSDAELIAYLAEREHVLDHRVFHAVLELRASGYVPPLEHSLLTRAFENVHATRLERFCLGEAVVCARRGLTNVRRVQVPFRVFEDAQAARAWLLTCLQKPLS